MQPRPADGAPIAGCRGEGNEVRLDVPGELDAPVIVLQEIHLHGEGPPQPTIAIWADGLVVFSQDVAGTARTLQSQIAPRVAIATARSLFASIGSLPRYETAHVNYSQEGGQITTITVRDGATWRAVSVYGYGRSDLEPGATDSTAEPEPEPEPEPAPEPEEGYGVSISFAPLQRRPLAPPFATAYRQLLALAPSTGTRVHPHDFEVIFIEPDPTPRPAPIEWPVDLPAPPAELQPSNCSYNDTAGCPFVLGPEYRDAATRFDDRILNNNVVRPVLVHGKTFMARFDWMYRGERVIDAVVACSEELGRRARATQRQP